MGRGAGRRSAAIAAIGPIALVIALATTAAPAQTPSEPTLEEALAALPAYRFGESRAALTVIAERVDDVSGREEEEARRLAGRLSLLLTGNATDDAKRFVCRQLALIGGEGCVPLLIPLLEDEALAAAAEDALQRIPHPAAGRALAAALDQPAGRRPVDVIGIIGAIGARGDAAALGAIAPLIDDPDPATAGAAIAAVGAIGGMEAASRLEAALRAADRRAARRTALVDAVLVCAGALHESGRSARAVELYRLVLDRAGPPHERMAALRGLVEAGGADPGRIVTDLLREEDARWWLFAAELVRTVRRDRATRAFAQAIPGLPPERATLLIEALADRGDPAATPALAEAASASAQDEVRLAAIRALGAVGEAPAVPVLTRLAAAPGAPAESALARRSLRRLRGAGVNAAIAARVVSSSDAAERIEAIRALGDRGARAQAEIVAGAASDGDAEVRRAAWETLALIGGPAELRAAVETAAAPRQEGDRALAATAAVEIARRIGDPVHRSATMLDAMLRADETGQKALLRVMGRTGGAPALERVRAALNEPALRATAIAALAEWPDDAPAPDLLAVAEAAPGTAEGRVALLGYVRLAGLPGPRPAAERVAMHRRAWALAGDAETRRMVLGGLAGVPDPGALDVALRGLDDPEVADAAARAVVAIAGRLGPGDRTAALTAINDALARRGDDDELRRVAGVVVDRLESDRDYVTAWAVAGPYERAGAGAIELFDVAFPPEQAGEPAASVAWTALASTDPGFPGRLDLDRAIGGDNRCAYVRTRLVAGGARRVRLELGSDDGIKAWLNGEMVHANNVLRALRPGADQVDVPLRAGDNDLMLEITEGGGDWAFTCRVRDPLGFHAEDVRVADAATLAAPPRGAVILFDGGGVRAWRHPDGRDVAWSVADGALVVRPGAGSIETRDLFTDFVLHVGFMIPKGLGGAGQTRANSGVYLQNRYEVQILDSAGDEPSADGCGAIYGRLPPRVNAARPAGAWQEYLIDFTAPRFDASGARTRRARISVWQNGYLIHDDVEIDGPTGEGEAEGPAPGPIGLQDHGQPVRFRDVWVLRVGAGE